MTVSVALIVKNEERTLERCLGSIREAVDEVVVVDTGSTDATKEVARRFDARLFDFAWCDDFAAARQFAFDRATSNWVFWLDADDIVLGAERIRPLTEGAPAEVFGFYWRYVLGRDARGEPTFSCWRERCVRNDGGFRWHGRVHEVLVAREPRLTIKSDEVVIEHQQEPGQIGRPGRNLRILEDEYRAAGGSPEPRVLFYLGREHAEHGNTARAIELLERYVRVGTWDDERYLAQVQLARIYLGLGETARAIDAYLAALKIYPCWPDAYFGLAATYYDHKDWPKVVHWAELGRSLPVPETLLFSDIRGYEYDWLIYYTNALYHVGRVEDALAFTRHALRVAPDDAWHRHNLGFFEGALAASAAGPAEPVGLGSAGNPIDCRSTRPVREKGSAARPTVLVVLGTRPEAIKLAPVVRLLCRDDQLRTRVVATGQHRKLLDQALAIFGLTPDLDLDLMTEDQGLPDLTGRLLAGLDRVLAAEQPAAVLVQGDTTTAFAAALAAFYRRVAVGHVEAGLRSGDRGAPFPEEVNRRLIAHLATWHFAPTARSREALLREEVPASAIIVTGNTVVDALRHVLATTAPPPSDLPARDRRLLVVTAHRREHFGARLEAVCRAVRRLADAYPDLDVCFPVHPNPRVGESVRRCLVGHPRIHLRSPADYAAFLHLLARADLVLTDSGGVLEEAATLGIPVLILRDATERTEAIDVGRAELVGTDEERIVERAEAWLRRGARMPEAELFGDGRASHRIVRFLRARLLGEPKETGETAGAG